jgi:hypothetical protein
MRRATLIVGAVGCCVIGGVVGGQAVRAASERTAPSIQNLKATPGAHVANIRGLRYAFGHVVTANAAGSTGFASLTYSIARCPHGTHALSGGWSSADTTQDPVTITSSIALKHLTGWLVGAIDTSTSDTSPGYTYQTFAVCG